jgi:hypothetical protein
MYIFRKSDAAHMQLMGGVNTEMDNTPVDFVAFGCFEK